VREIECKKVDGEGTKGVNQEEDERIPSPGDAVAPAAAMVDFSMAGYIDGWMLVSPQPVPSRLHAVGYEYCLLTPR
jgi:hypothetical protein